MAENLNEPLRMAINCYLYFRFLVAGIVYAREQLGNLYKNATEIEKMNFKSAGHDFESTGKIQQGNVDIICAPGMKGNIDVGWCGRFCN